MMLHMIRLFDIFLDIDPQDPEILENFLVDNQLADYDNLVSTTSLDSNKLSCVSCVPVIGPQIYKLTLKISRSYHIIAAAS